MFAIMSVTPPVEYGYAIFVEAFSLLVVVTYLFSQKLPPFELSGKAP